MDSILTSIKKLLGIPEEYTQFDQDIIMHINSAFFTLAQLGVGEDPGYAITGSTETWSDFFKDQEWVIETVKSYIYLRVRLLFDPTTTSAVLESMNKQIAEMEWRMSIVGDMLNAE